MSDERVWILVEEQHARDAVHGVSRTREGAMALAGDQVVWRKDGGMRGSVLGILLLKIGGTTIAVLVANGDQATVVDADPDYADGLRNHLRHGAWYPPGTPLAEYSFPAKAKGRDKLAKIGALYAKLFRAHALLSEIPDPIARKPDPT